MPHPTRMHPPAKKPPRCRATLPGLQGGSVSRCEADQFHVAAISASSERRRRLATSGGVARTSDAGLVEERVDGFHAVRRRLPATSSRAVAEVTAQLDKGNGFSCARLSDDEQ